MTTDDRGVYAIDAKGSSSKTKASGTLIAVDPSQGAFVCVVVNGRVRCDVRKFTVDGMDLRLAGTIQRVVNGQAASVRISPDGKQVGVVAGGGWSGRDRGFHYAVPIYDTGDMKTMLGEMQTGAYPSGLAYHPTLPLAVAVNWEGGSLFNTKSFAATKKISARRKGAMSVLAFGGKGKTLIYGTTERDSSALKFMSFD